MREIWQRILDWLGSNSRRALYALGGLIAAILLMTMGFWRTLLLGLLIALGWYIGGITDYKAWLLRIMQSIAYAWRKLFRR